MLQIEPLLERKPRQLSGGQRQRVAIGRAVVREPRVFLFDEPLSNLDAELRVQMRVEIAALHARLGNTMIYVTHDQVEAMTMADKIVVLRLGRVEQTGAPLELYNAPANRFVAGFIGSPRMNFLDGRIRGDRRGRRHGRDRGAARPADRGRWPGRGGRASRSRSACGRSTCSRARATPASRPWSTRPSSWAPTAISIANCRAARGSRSMRPARPRCGAASARRSACGRRPATCFAPTRRARPTAPRLTCYKSRGRRMREEPGIMAATAREGPFVIIAEFDVKPEGLERFLALARDDASQSVAKEPGCHQFDVTVEQSDA